MPASLHLERVREQTSPRIYHLPHSVWCGTVNWCWLPLHWTAEHSMYVETSPIFGIVWNNRKTKRKGGLRIGRILTSNHTKCFEWSSKRMSAEISMTQFNHEYEHGLEGEHMEMDMNTVFALFMFVPMLISVSMSMSLSIVYVCACPCPYPWPFSLGVKCDFTMPI